MPATILSRAGARRCSTVGIHERAFCVVRRCCRRRARARDGVLLRTALPRVQTRAAERLGVSSRTGDRAPPRRRRALSQCGDAPGQLWASNSSQQALNAAPLNSALRHRHKRDDPGRRSYRRSGSSRLGAPRPPRGRPRRLPRRRSHGRRAKRDVYRRGGVEYRAAVARGGAPHVRLPAAENRRDVRGARLFRLQDVKRDGRRPAVVGRTLGRRRGRGRGRIYRGDESVPGRHGALRGGRPTPRGVRPPRKRHGRLPLRREPVLQGRRRREERDAGVRRGAAGRGTKRRGALRCGLFGADIAATPWGATWIFRGARDVDIPRGATSSCAAPRRSRGGAATRPHGMSTSRPAKPRLVFFESKERARVPEHPVDICGEIRGPTKGRFEAQKGFPRRPAAPRRKMGPSSRSPASSA